MTSSTGTNTYGIVKSIADIDEAIKPIEDGNRPRRDRTASRHRTTCPSPKAWHGVGATEFSERALTFNAMRKHVWGHIQGR